MNKNMACPKCGGEVWNNVLENDKRENNGEKLRPDYSCKDKDKCGWVQWREKPRTPKEEKVFHSSDKLPPIKDPVFEGTKKTTGGQPLVTKKEPDWDAKEKREHKRALTMQAFGLFPPRNNEDGTNPMDRWLAIKDMRDLMLGDLYND